MHDAEFLHEHAEPSDEERAELARFIWSQEHVELKTVGIDIGSSTSHLLFAKVLLQRHAQGLSSRFVVVDRQVVWRSPIMLTPFLPDGTIDAHALAHFIEDCYEDAGFAQGDIDSGAVILTGEAIKRKNARAIDELFAAEAGKFVCATAGHMLECRLAAHGSGAVRLSRERGQCVLHVDIGGGTTKLALIDRGTVLSAAAFAAGGRLLASDAEGEWTRVDDSARLVAEELGLATDPRSLADPAARDALARRLAAVMADYILGAPRDRLGEALRLTERVAADGGAGGADLLGRRVGIYLRRRGAASTATSRCRWRARSARSWGGARACRSSIRASASAPPSSARRNSPSRSAARPSTFPIPKCCRSMAFPVVHVGRAAEDDPDTLADAIRNGLVDLDLDPDSRVAIAFSWHGDPDYHRLAAAGRAIIAATAPNGARSEPLFLMIDGDIGRTLGRLLHRRARPAGAARVDRRRPAPGPRLCRCRRHDLAAGRGAGGHQVAAVFVRRKP